MMIVKFLKKFHVAMRNSPVTRELTVDLRGTEKSIAEFQPNALANIKFLSIFYVCC